MKGEGWGRIKFLFPGDSFTYFETRKVAEVKRVIMKSVTRQEARKVVRGAGQI